MSRVVSHRAFCVASCLVALLGCGVATTVAQTPDERQGVCEKIAREFLKDMSSGKYQAAGAQFSEKMRSAMPPTKVKQVWEAFESEFGTFVSFGPSSHEEVGSYRVVYIEATFNQAQRRLKIVFDADNRIAGFFHEPLGPEASAPESPFAPWKSPAYDKPKQYVERDITVGEAPWELGGKVVMPVGKKHVPIVVLVHGSGPTDEDETIGPNKPFKDLAVGLASKGIAVLRYQKRTHAYKLRLAAQKTITVREEVIEDALEALKCARSQPDVDQSKVFLLGHSLGATLAPQIAEEDGRLAGVIMMSGTPRDFTDVIEGQLKYIASLKTPNQEKMRVLYEQSKKTISEWRAGGTSPDTLLLSVPLAYWDELTHYAVRSLDVAGKLKCPMLIVGGGRDYQVTKTDFDLYRAALGKRPTVTMRWFDNVNHLFIESERMAVPDDYAKPGHISGEVVEAIIGWIHGG